MGAAAHQHQLQQQQHVCAGHGSSSSSNSSTALADGCAWSLNVGSAVAIVFVNKVLMSRQGGYAFTFAVTLSAIHFLTAAACVMAAQAAGLAAKAAHVPWRATLGFSLVAVVSIGSLNLSLLVNPVGLYQVAKLLVIPFVCGVEAAWMGRRFNHSTLAAIATVMAGVGVVTVNDLDSGATQALGVLLAAVSVVASGMQQILCGSLQRAYKLQSHQLLAATAAVQGGLLLLLGPWVDAAVSGRWVGQYAMTLPALWVLLLSCAFSVGVNVSQFMCLGRFSAATFQVLGHTKTVLVLLISWLALGEAMSPRKAAGMAVAVAGMVAYGYCVSIDSSSRSSSSSSSAGRKASKPGSVGGSGGTLGLGAVELGQGMAQRQQQHGLRNGQQGSAGDGGSGEAAEADVPLLRNVSQEHSRWAGESVVVVAVQRQGDDGSTAGSSSSSGRR